MKRTFSVLMITLLLVSMFTATFSIRAAGTGLSQLTVPDEPATMQETMSLASQEPSPPPTEWDKAYGGTSYDEAYALVQTADGGYAIAGDTNSFGAGNGDFWLVKTDGNGNMEWCETYGGINYDGANALVQTGDGGYALAGYTASFGAGSYDFWLVKTDASGTMQWNMTYGGRSYDGAYALVQTGDGGYALAGYTGSSGIGDYYNYNFWLVKTDALGNVLWSKTYGEIYGEDWAFALVQTADGGYALAGYTDSFGAGSYDFWLVKTDALGNVLWSKTYGGTGEDWASALVQTADGGCALAGYTASFGAGDYDFWLVKLGRAEGIYIRADGSIDPPDAPITTFDNVTYTLTSNISSDADGIVVERDNIVVDGEGYTVSGTGSGTGLSLSGRSNVTIKSMTIKAFYYGLWLRCSSNNSVSGNNITANNVYGIELGFSSDISISGNNITNNWYGIELGVSSNNGISGNNITENNGYGIYLYSSSNSSISGNNITNNRNGLGIYLHDSPNNTLRNNKIVNNAFTLKVDGENLLDFVNDVDVSNTVDGGLVYYWINEKDRTIPHDAGWVALINCTRITVQNLVLNKSGQGLTVAYTTNSTITQNNVTANNDDGIYLWFSSNNSIVGNNITNNAYGNGCGIHFWFSSNNSIVGNNITNNGYGIYLYDSSNSSVVENNITANNEDGIHLWSSSNNSIVGNNITANDEHGILLYYSSNNSIYFDNFINNTVNADSSWSSNIWNSPAPITYTYNGSEYVNYLGSYWSDYSGIDIDNDGIGDSSYSVDSESDYYPLMQPFETYFQVPSTVEVIMYEITSRTQALTETIISQNATLNTTVTGDFDAVLNFTNLEIVLITSGSFAGKGFSKGNWSTNIEGNSYEGSWQGMLFKKPEERKISLKGMVSGGLKGIVEGFLSESVNGSEIYDQYQATWTISHIGADVVFAKLNLNGTIDYQESVEYSSELYALQTSIQGEASGYYDGALSIVLTQVLLTCRGIG